MGSTELRIPSMRRCCAAVPVLRLDALSSSLRGRSRRCVHETQGDEGALVLVSCEHDCVRKKARRGGENRVPVEEEAAGALVWRTAAPAVMRRAMIFSAIKDETVTSLLVLMHTPSVARAPGSQSGLPVSNWISHPP
eukprot:scaffold535_cov260-Pinguiococcus_pyrenoidosus.AAC.43